MDQSINYKPKIDFLISSNTSLSHPTQTTYEPKSKKCNECNQDFNRKRKFNEIHQICDICYRAKTVFIPSGNKDIDDFIWYTLTNAGDFSMRMEYVPYDRFKDVEFIAEGGFSRIYKATWIDGPISSWDPKIQRYRHSRKMEVALKELNNSKNINSKDLNELKIFYNFALDYGNYYSKGNIANINKYYGITQHPNSQNFMIITKYYKERDLKYYLTNDFFKINWEVKLEKLRSISYGLRNIHEKDIVHKDYHSGNIFIDKNRKNKEIAITGDLGLSKSSLDDNDNEIYGIIPYVAPEIFQGQKYTKDSDIYGFGMIMWELMTGRRPFWDQSHDTDLIIKICDGFRPPIVTNAPEGYIELMQQCWHSDPMKRPTALNIRLKIFDIKWKNTTKIIESPDIGPITNNPDAIYKSRPLSAMIKSAKSTISLKSTISDIGSPYYNQNNNDDKRKFDDNDKDKITKKIKLFENNNNDYFTKELEFDVDSNINFCESSNNAYFTKELGFDIDSNINFCESSNNEYFTKELEFDIDDNINFSKSNDNGNDYNTKEIDFDI